MSTIGSQRPIQAPMLWFSRGDLRCGTPVTEEDLTDRDLLGDLALRLVGDLDDYLRRQAK